MCYDYFGAWDKKIGFNAPLESQDDVESEEIRNLNVKFSIEYFIKLGAPKEKLMLGLPFYGRTFITQNKGDHGDASDETGFAGPYTRENGFNGYNEICKSLANPEWKAEWNVRSSEALARVQTVNGTQVVTYDSPRSIANKVRYAIREGLGGVMVW
jgi:chitinase